MLSRQTGLYFLDENVVHRKVSLGLFNWWRKNSSYPVTEPSSSLQFQVEALPFSLQTLVDRLEGSPDPPAPRPSLQSWGFSTFISVLVIFYSFVLLASIKIVTVFILLYNYRRLYFKPRCFFILSCIFVLAFCRRLLKIRRNSQPQCLTWKKTYCKKSVSVRS